MKSILVAGFLIFSTVSQSQTPLPYIEGVVAIRG